MDTRLLGLLLTVSILLALVVACTQIERTPDDSLATPTPGGRARGHGPLTYDRSVPITSGQYVSPAGYPEAQERGIAAWNAEAGMPKFRGTVNGIELFTFDDPEKRNFCGGNDFADFREFDALVFDYLPPGTSARGPQWAAICPDGSVAAIGQELVLYNAGLTITYEYGQNALPHDASASRVFGASVAGRPSVIIKPLTEEGFGRSWIASLVPQGLIIISAVDLPLSETTKIMEGIRCDTC
jgi:hypothetical protein